MRLSSEFSRRGDDFSARDVFATTPRWYSNADGSESRSDLPKAVARPSMLYYTFGRLTNRKVPSNRDPLISKRLEERHSLRIVFRGGENDVDRAGWIVMFNESRYSGVISAIKACAIHKSSMCSLVDSARIGSILRRDASNAPQEIFKLLNLT